MKRDSIPEYDLERWQQNHPNVKIIHITPTTQTSVRYEILYEELKKEAK